MIRRPPRSTRTTHSFPTRCSSDLLGKDLIEPIEQPFVLHESCTGEIIEFFWPPGDDIAVERLQQHEMLLHAGAYARRAKLIEKIEEHRLSYRAIGPTWNHETDFVQRSEAHTSELKSLMHTSYPVFCFTKK